MVLPPIAVDRRFHIFMNNIPYPKGSLNVLIAHFGTFSCKCGIRTEINSLFIRGEANEGNQIATAAESFCGFFTPIFKISCSRLWKNTLAGVVGSRGKIAKLLWREYVEVSEQTNRGNGCRPPYGTPSFAFAGNPFP